MPTISGRVTITQPGTYVLTRDIVLPAGQNGAGIEIAASNVTIDLNGHTIISAGGAATRAIGVHALDRSGIEIKNGVISQCLYGVRLESSSPLGLTNGGHTIEDLTVTACTFRGLLVDGHDNTITGNTIWRVSGTTVYPNAYCFGIEVHGPHATITNNLISEVYSRGGEAVGISLSHNGVGSVVTGNTIANSHLSDFRSFGIWSGGGSSIDAEANTISRYHYALGGGSSDDSLPVTDNNFIDTPYPFLWHGGLISDNTSTVTPEFFKDQGTTVDDVLIAAAQGSQLLGLQGRDQLFGQAGNDELHGHAGLDVLYGSGGADTFFFDTRPWTDNVDTIVDYGTGGDDHIALARLYFGKAIAANGDVRISNTGPHGRGALMIYSPSSHMLSYDPDGIGTAHAVPVAKVLGTSSLTADDFIV